MKVNAYIGNIYRCLEKDDRIRKAALKYNHKPFVLCSDEYLKKQQLYKKEAILIEIANSKYVDLDNIDCFKKYKDLLDLKELYYPEEFGIMGVYPIDNDDLFVDERSLNPYSINPISLKRLIKENKRR